MRTIRVVVIEDSLTVRRHLVETLAAEADIDVVGEAADGAAGIEICRALRPDLVVLDMMLPVMTGLDATESIMAHFPTPILIVSSSINRGEAFRTCDALAAGALDVLEKPDASRLEGEAWDRELLRRVRMLHRIRVITHPRGRLRPTARPLPAGPPGEGGTARRNGSPRVVAIGASTGGPGALLAVLGALPADFPLPVLLVLHIAEAFGASFAEWLGTRIAMPVALVRDGDPLPRPGRASLAMAPPGRHLVVAGDRLRLQDGPERHACRPSVDVLFESVARELGPAAVACLLTGMGRDGAEGLLALRRAGARTAAQDEATSVVFGMPGEAVRLGAAEAVLPVQELAPWLDRAARGRIS